MSGEGMSGEGPPQVSVIVAAWNAQTTLRRAIESVLQQTGIRVEVIIVDDASTDGTLNLAKSLQADDRRIKVMRQTLNAGPAAARNKAIEVAQAPFITPLDSDDFMMPERLQHLHKIAVDGTWDFVADDLFQVNETDVNGPKRRLWSEQELGQVDVSFADFVAGNLSSQHRGRSEMGFVKPLMSRAFLERTQIRYREDMRLGEDYMLYSTALLNGARFVLTDPAGYVAVVRPNSLSGHHSARDLGALVSADVALLADHRLPPEGLKILRAHHLETSKKWHWMRMIDAAKARSIRGFFGCFIAPPAVGLHLIKQLGAQIVLRTQNKLASPRNDGVDHG